jgi:hypothetical protein
VIHRIVLSAHHGKILTQIVSGQVDVSCPQDLVRETGCPQTCWTPLASPFLGIYSNSCSSRNRRSGGAPFQGATEHTAPEGCAVVITASSLAGKRCGHSALGTERRSGVISTAAGMRLSTGDSVRPMPTNGRRDSRYAHSGPSMVGRVRVDLMAAPSLVWLEASAQATPPSTTAAAH